MPPQKGFSGQIEYSKRGVHDDFLEQFPLSVHEITKGRELIPKNPRVAVVEGFYDKANSVRDAQVSMGGFELFRKWFSEPKLDTLSNF